MDLSSIDGLYRFLHFPGEAAGAPPPGVTAPGTSIKLYARTSTPRVVTIKPRQSTNKCLDVKDRSTADRAESIQFTCNGQTNQQFRIDDVTP